MSDSVSIAELRTLPLFAGLGASRLAALRGGLRPVPFGVGTVLIRQGRPPDGAWFLESGAAEVVARMPGGDERLLGTVGAGDMVGDTGLIDGRPRTATVRASEGGRALFLDGGFFRGLTAQRDAAALGVLRNVHRGIAERIRAMGADLDGLEGNGAGAVPAAVLPATAGDPAFDVRAYLPVLPFFVGFRPAQIDRLMAEATALEIPAGSALYRAGDAGDTCFIVVRGAVWALAGGDTRRLPRAVLGPGRAVGLLSMLLGGVHGTTCLSREGATVIALPRQAFAALYDGEDDVALAVLDAVGRDLLAIMGRMANDLARAAGQGLIHGRGMAHASR